MTNHLLRLHVGILALSLFVAPVAASGYFTAESVLLPSDPEQGDGIGRDVDIDGDRAVVGTSGGRAIHVFERSDAGWRLMQTLNWNADDFYFGIPVAIDGDVIVAGVPADSTFGTRAGSALVFEYDGSEWRRTARLIGSDIRSREEFGSDVDVDGNTIVVGAFRHNAGEYQSGGAYVFERTAGGSWVEQVKMVPSTLRRYGYFGTRVQVKGDTAAAVDPLDEIAVYRKGAAGWERETTLPPAGAPYTTIGTNFSLDHDAVAATHREEVVVYRRSGGEWRGDERFELDPPPSTTPGEIALEGDTLIMGLPRYSGPTGGGGAVFVFRHDGSQWGQDQVLRPGVAHGNASFGYQLGMAAGRIIVGAEDYFDTYDTGVAYIFEGGPGLLQPVADAGGDAQIECTSPDGATMTLDGSGSYDDDSTPGTSDDIVLFEWFRELSIGRELMDTGESVEQHFPLGDHGVSLRVTDGFGLTADDFDTKSVIDSTAPFGSVTAPLANACVGEAGLPVVVEDDFVDRCDDEPKRRYTPPFQHEYKAFDPNSTLIDGLGGSVDVSGDIAVAGAPGAEFHGTGSGAAEVYRFDGDEWTHESTLVPESGDRYDVYGRSVAVSGDVVVVSSDEHDHFGPRSGAAFVYRHIDGSWELEQVLGPDTLEFFTGFGRVVDIDGDVIVVGAWADRDLTSGNGAIYVFERDDGIWQQTDKLYLDDPFPWDQLGVSVAIDGDRIAGGANGLDPGGAAFVFARNEGGWELEGELVPSDAVAHENAGFFIALDGDLAAVAAPNHSGGGYNLGGVWVFRRQASGEWIEEGKVVPEVDRFGPAAFGRIDINGGRLVVGAATDSEIRSRSGAVFLAEKREAGWILVRKIKARDPSYSELLGVSVALDGDRLMAGVRDGRGASSGSGYVWIKELKTGYERHGDYSVSLNIEDRDGNASADTADFVIDRQPPAVIINRPPEPGVIPGSVAFADLFTASDQDNATGGVLQERLLIGPCVAFDGNHYGNGDGLLADEQLVLDQATLCDLLQRCGDPPDGLSTMTVEAVDCGGNVGRATIETPQLRVIGLMCPRGIEPLQQRIGGFDRPNVLGR